MTDQPQNGAAAEPQMPQLKILGQYIRDMSFENIAAQKGLENNSQPDIQVQVNLDAKKRAAENQYEVATKLNITAKTKEAGDVIFALEVDYAGVFQIENIADEQLHPFLLIECPRMTFPFLRRIVSDVTRDGGFPPLNLDLIDFVALYRQEIARRAAAQQAAAGTAQA
ncbi:protein-export chaperone SecB [Tropicimonas sp. S265A]|uniref:protein-export chaperone SecB n=1 Tax=Tropicimonas sp. S265A TaxID=3415134 RepID=UPI003C7AED41